MNRLWLRWTLNCAAGEIIGIGLAAGIAAGCGAMDHRQCARLGPGTALDLPDRFLDPHRYPNSGSRCYWVDWRDCFRGFRLAG